MHICTAGMLRLHTPSTHIPPSHLRGTLFSCPQRHTPGLETWEMWGQPKAETQEIPQQKPCHMPKSRPLSGQGSEDREDWGGSLGVGKVLPAGELVLAVGFALTPLPQGCQGAEALALALGALALQAPLLQVSPGRGGGGGCGGYQSSTSQWLCGPRQAALLFVSSSGKWLGGSHKIPGACAPVHALAHTFATSRHLLHFAGALASPLQPPKKGAGCS